MIFSETNRLPHFLTGSPLCDSDEPFSSTFVSLPHPGEGLNRKDNPKTLPSNSGSEPDRKSPQTISPTGRRLALDERKRRRKISNRESARRSRVRKQEHLEKLTSQLDRLRIENRGVMDRLRLIVCADELTRRENERLLLEAAVMRRRLWDMRQVLVVRELQQHLNNPLPAWPCNNNINNNNFTSINEGQLINAQQFNYNVINQLN